MTEIAPGAALRARWFKARYGSQPPASSFALLDKLDQAAWEGIAQPADDDLHPITIEQHRWYAVVRDGGENGEVVKVIGYRGDSGISYHDSVAEWEAASS